MKLDLGLIRDTALLHLQQTLTSSIFIISFIFYTSDFSTPTFTTKKWNYFFIRHPVWPLSGGAGGGSGNDNGDIF